MKKLSFLAALLCASMMSYAAPTNFALASEGSSAEATSGNAALAIDGNNGTRWESGQTDDETWTLNLGQARTFNQIKINWEGAYCTEYTISTSNDGEDWTLWHSETGLGAAGWWSVYKETPVTAQYIQYHGTKRATQYGQSFFEFEVYYLESAPKVYTQIEGLTIVANSTGENDVNRVIDGNAGTEWQGRPAGMTGGDEESRTFDAWFVADLGGFYTVEKVDIHFEGACAQDYHIDFSLDNENWELGYDFVGTTGVYGRTDEVTELDNNQKVRFVRFWSTKAATEWGMKIFEFRVYGAEWVDSGDTEAPVMVSAALVSKTWNSAVIAVSATDNHEVVKYHVVDATNEIDVKCFPAEGKITVKDLISETGYNFVITAIDAAGNESANSKAVAVTTPVRIIVPNVAAPVPTWDASLVKSLYSDTYDFAPANLIGYNQEWWNNPTMTEEAVDGDHYLHYHLYREGMIGAQFGDISVLNLEKVHIDIFASAAGSVTFRPITVDGPNTPKKLDLEAEQWNSFDIDLSEFAGHDWSKLFQFAIEGYQAGGLVGEHISVDNIYFYRTAALVDEEKPTEVTASVASESYFSVVLSLSAKDNSGAVIFDVKNGEEIIASGAGASGANIQVVVPNLQPNTNYAFSVVAKDEAGNEAEPVNVNAKTQAAPKAAPAPDFSGKVTVAVFCDALEGNPAINIGAWGQTTQAQVVELAEGNHAFFGANFNYLGWELAPAANAAAMEYFHVDFFSPALTKVSITPISPAHEGEKVVALVPGEWVSADIAISDFAAAGIAWDNIFQFKFFNPSENGGELFIDNVYFFADSTETALEEVKEAVPARKVMESGVLYIIRDGVRYSVTGVRVK
jgi:chitodextrinase